MPVDGSMLLAADDALTATGIGSSIKTLVPSTGRVVLLREGSALSTRMAGSFAGREASFAKGSVLFVRRPAPFVAGSALTIGELFHLKAVQQR